MGCCAGKARKVTEEKHFYKAEEGVMQVQIDIKPTTISEDKTFAASNDLLGASHFVVATFDYDPPTEEELALTQGETIEILEDLTVMRSPNQWLRAKSTLTHETGFVPIDYLAHPSSLESQPWFFGNISRTETHVNLLNPENEIGAFLVRKTLKQSHSFSLSVLMEDGIKHFKIEYSDKGVHFSNARNYFKSIQELILFHTEYSGGLGITLKNPCVRKNLPVTKDLAHSTRDMWEIERSSLTFIRKLGQGQFGEVWEGRWNKKTPVAIKTFKPKAMDRESFLAEAKIMKQMHHYHLVQLYAVCTKEEPIYIITELMGKGSLLYFMRTENPDLPLLINMAFQVSSGMMYLEKYNYVHRDLAARNVLVSDNYVAKVGDFGLATVLKKTFLENKYPLKIAIKWSSPEVIKFYRFSIKSDVWSFGILLYEIVTKGQSPYKNISNRRVIEMLTKENYRISRPDDCPRNVFKIMQLCWMENPEERPTFIQLNSLLDECMKELDYEELDE